MPSSDPNQLLLDNYIDLLWGEFNDIIKTHQVAPLILAFAVIEANAKLSAPDEVIGPKARFRWWVDKYLRHADGTVYPSLDLYGARCGLFHEYGAESDLSRSGKCRIIAWISGDAGQHHNKSQGNMVMFSTKQFFDDLYAAGIRLLEELKADVNFSARFAAKLPKIFGAIPIEEAARRQVTR